MGRAALVVALSRLYGADGFWTRLEGLRPRALFVWGDSDGLVPAGFSRPVAEALPDARQVLLPQCGHVPQVELPERTNGLIAEHIEHIERVSSAGSAPRRVRIAGRRLAGALAHSA